MAPRSLIQIMGVPFTATEQWWQFVPPKLIIGFVVAFLAMPEISLAERFLAGLLFGGLLLVLSFHTLGHVLSSKLVLPPMSEARITPLLIETRYENDPALVPSKVHLVRSLGGPLMNFALGAISLIIWGITRSPAVAFFAGANFVIGLLVLLPISSLDGGVIWREVFSRRRAR